jgi:acetyl esterase/lipase
MKTHCKSLGACVGMAWTLLVMPSPFADEVPAAARENILYRTGDGLTDYMRERCRLDVYCPSEIKAFPTVVWFHGGGLKAGNRSCPEALKDQGIAVVSVNYRLHPKVEAPAYIEDAAAAVAWTFKNIERFGGSRDRIFVSGHSAGGYLTSMIGLDKRWLAAHGVDANDIAGLIPYSGHTITHFTVRAERGIPGEQPIIGGKTPLPSSSSRVIATWRCWVATRKTPTYGE